ncbi:disks large homolog 5-like [Elysia marginata]|uniref:Disks large homolog 5-like n=1 Tax=Elysia marginata TaxID=1093978 RepID=A0AAV4GCJ6_9GAST|nr:disks large homolog 5-like [Elysia marginata]
MEFKERIELNRTKLEQTLEAEKLLCLLQEDKALTAEETAQVMSLPTKTAQTSRLIDLLLSKDNAALQSFYLVLQKMYQHVLTSLFVELPFTTRRSKPQHQQELCSTSLSLTSDSEEDGSRRQLAQDPCSSELSKITKTMSPHQYDPNSTMSSSYPNFREQPSPMSSMSMDGVSSPGLASSSSPSSLLTMPTNRDAACGVVEGNSLKLLKQQYEQQQQQHQQHKPFLLSHSYSPHQPQMQLTANSKAGAPGYPAYPSGSPPDKGYEWFFQQFEHAIKELQLLKQQNAEMINIRDRHDQACASKELKHLRLLYSGESQCLQQARAEVHSLKSQQMQLLSEKNQLLQEMSSLQRKISSGGPAISSDNSNQSSTSPNNSISGPSCPSSGAISSPQEQLYSSLLDNHEALRADHEVLREKYQGLLSSHTAALGRLDQLEEEAASSQAALDDLRVKAEFLTQERNGLKQQCTDAIRKWNQTLIDHSQIKEKLGMVINQRDTLSRDFNQSFARHAELKKNYEALRVEKDAAVKEYALVMSERDTVHKEIEQLQDKLTSLSKHTEGLSADKMDLESQLEASRRDLAAVLIERDKYRREWSDMSGINQGLKHERLEFKMRMEQQRDMARQERNEALDQMEQIIKDTYEKTQKEKAEEIDSVVKESENLKKQVEKLKLDLENFEQEAENANKNRDKAFSERDKIVQERESIRTLCDNLRRDRDHAVSDLAQALRDSDEFKRQKNDAVRELKEIKTRYEAMVEKDSRRNQLHCIGHNHSRDSAIDADLHDLYNETIEVQVELENLSSGQLGFEVVGGKDDTLFPNDPSLFVSHIIKGGAADGRLKVNDVILKINSLETLNVEKVVALQTIWKNPQSVNMTVRRRKFSAAPVWQPVQIVLSAQKDHGLKIEQGLFISRVSPGPVGAKFGMLPFVGDRIINVNNIPADSLSARDVMHILDSSSDSLVLDLWRQTSPLSSAGSSPTPTSTGVGSPLHDGGSGASVSVGSSGILSKPEAAGGQHGSGLALWGPGGHIGAVGGDGSGERSSKDLRCSGSQTDSLDSPGPSLRKDSGNSCHLDNQNNNQDNKVRHSMPMLDKAKVTVEKIFSRSRHKSQEEKSKDKETLTRVMGQDKQQEEQNRKIVEDCATQVNLSHTENVIAEFPNSSAAVFTQASGNANNDEQFKFSRKREIEVDINSGTWPKTRSQHTPPVSVPPTIMAPTGHKSLKARPSIKDVFYGTFNPETSSYEDAVHHNAQNSHLSIKYPDSSSYSSSTAPSSSSAFSATTSAFSLVSSSGPFKSTSLYSAVTVPGTSLAVSHPPTVPSVSSSAPLPLSQSSSKPQSHFTVGIMHGPGNTPFTLGQHGHPYPQQQPHHGGSYHHYTVVGPTKVKSSPGMQLYGTIPGSRHNQSGTMRGSLVSSQQPHHHLQASVAHSHAMPQDFRFVERQSAINSHKVPSRATPMKSRQRPVSTPQRPEGWQAPSPAWLASGRHVTSAESSLLGHHPPSHTNSANTAVNGAHPFSFSGTSLTSNSLPSSSYHKVMAAPSLAAVLSPPPHPHDLSSPPAYGTRPVSLEVHGMKVSDCESNQRLAPKGSYIIQPPPPQHPAFHTVSSSSSQPLSGLPSPPGTFPVISSSEADQDQRPLSYHDSPTERYSSPSPSQKSYSTLERFTPTINEELYPSRYSRASPHGQLHSHHLGRSAVIDEEVLRHQNAFNAKRDVFERIRIPSTTSVNTKSGSVEIVSDRSSPGSPLFHLDTQGSLNQKNSPYSDEYICRKTPSHHETRDILFEKSSKPVGFKIQGGPSGGIFVSSVNDNSLAAQAGLVIGDQLLEVCGINMRNANYEHAVTVLRQCDDNLTMKVQYNPEKYTDHGADVSSSSSLTLTVSQATSPCHSTQQTAFETPTPKNLGRTFNQMPTDSYADKRRFITLKKSNPNMIGPGFSFIGGNAAGIFVHEVYSDCFVGGTQSLQRGDQILEFNAVDFRSVTAEKAMVELNRPCATMQLCVFYNISKFNKIRKMPCDSFYLRANFDRLLENDEGLELAFRRDDIIYVEESLYQGQLGSWFAWLLDPKGNKIRSGVVPSRIRLEDELVLRRTHSESWSFHEADDLKSSSRRSTASARRSFFRRRRHHRNSSKDSQEFGSSFSDASLNSDSVPILDDSKLGYTQVLKISLKVVRPVVLLAPLADALIKKLVSESPDKYRECGTVPMRTSTATMEQSVAEGSLVDYWKHEDVYQCVRVTSIKEICDSNVHCLLNVNPTAIERMHRCKIYPIVIFVKHKSSKQIRETRDPQFLKDRSSTKNSKELYEQFQKTEQDYHHLFSGIVQGGNLAEMCMHIKNFIAAEQTKAIWVTANNQQELI